MTGMKEGAGEDPFANGSESSTDSSDAQSDRRSDDPEERDENGRGQHASSSAEARSHSKDSESGAADEDRTRGSGQQQSMQIPYKYRRDGVQDGRDRVPLFLMPETKSQERDALREFEDRFDENVSLTDLREAVMKTGLQHLDDVEDELAAWGYGMTFDE